MLNASFSISQLSHFFIVQNFVLTRLSISFKTDISIYMQILLVIIIYYLIVFYYYYFVFNFISRINDRIEESVDELKLNYKSANGTRISTEYSANDNIQFQGCYEGDENFEYQDHRRKFFKKVSVIPICYSTEVNLKNQR